MYETHPGNDADGGTCHRASSANGGVDVVCVHGLQGGAVKTWRVPGKDPCAGARSHSGGGKDELQRGRRELYVVRHGARAGVWPTAWLAADLERSGLDVRVWAVTYDADVWLHESVRPSAGVATVAHDVRQQLLAAGVGASGRPVVYLAHSLGGILVKYMLTQVEEVKEGEDEGRAPDRSSPPSSLSSSSSSVTGGDDDCDERSGSGARPMNELALRTAGCVFYATPHRGAPVAAQALSGLHTIHRWLRTPDPHPLVTPHVLLLRDDAELERLNAAFARLVRRPELPQLLTAAADEESVCSGVNTGATNGHGEGSQRAAHAMQRSEDPGAPHIVVLSIAETVSSSIAQAMGYTPRIEGKEAEDPGRLSVLVVPPTRANPGYGAFATAQNADHISACKPPGMFDARYVLAKDLILEVAAAGSDER